MVFLAWLNAGPFFYGPKMSPKWLLSGLLNCFGKCNNSGMEQLLKILSEIGLPAIEIQRVCEFYRNDEAGLRDYVLYMRAMLDDRHEYI